jgi:hypothetical protein
MQYNQPDYSSSLQMVPLTVWHYTAMWTRQGSVHLSVMHGVYPNGAPRCDFSVTDTGVGIAGNIDVFGKYRQPQSMGKAPKGGSELSQKYLASVQQVGTVCLQEA